MKQRHLRSLICLISAPALSGLMLGCAVSASPGSDQAAVVATEAPVSSDYLQRWLNFYGSGCRDSKPEVGSSVTVFRVVNSLCSDKPYDWGLLEQELRQELQQLQQQSAIGPTKELVYYWLQAELNQRQLQAHQVQRLNNQLKQCLQQRRSLEHKIEELGKIERHINHRQQESDREIEEQEVNHNE